MSLTQEKFMEIVAEYGRSKFMEGRRYQDGPNISRNHYREQSEKELEKIEESFSDILDIARIRASQE